MCMKLHYINTLKTFFKVTCKIEELDSECQKKDVLFENQPISLSLPQSHQDKWVFASVFCATTYHLVFCSVGWLRAERARLVIFVWQADDMILNCWVVTFQQRGSIVPRISGISIRQQCFLNLPLYSAAKRCHADLLFCALHYVIH